MPPLKSRTAPPLRIEVAPPLDVFLSKLELFAKQSVDELFWFGYTFAKKTPLM